MEFAVFEPSLENSILIFAQIERQHLEQALTHILGRE